jgi:hypothetical protein
MPRMTYIPGSTVFTYHAREARTEAYRTWRGKGEMGWCWECLLCGVWESSQPTREAAVRRVAESHPSWCHVRTGCACPEPHITAGMAVRLGISGEFPARIAPVLFRLAGGVRKPCRPCFDRNGVPHCGTARQIAAAAHAEGLTGEAWEARVTELRLAVGAR